MLIEQFDDGARIAEQQSGCRRGGVPGCSTCCRSVCIDRADRFAVQDVAKECGGLLQIGYTDGHVAAVMDAGGMAVERHAGHGGQETEDQYRKEGLAHEFAPVTVLVAYMGMAISS